MENTFGKVIVTANFRQAGSTVRTVVYTMRA